MRRASSAASIGIVPEPHMGSTSAVSPVHPEPISIDAASVSLIGAFATACRYPRRWRRSPELSTLTVHTS